ncbi:MAG: hypothetical protein KBB91_01810 [Candidatus Pacebacteria bacterium]|jgi:hypothetical protein|nr:hypothetical protein [Candidatus Paceibacterota bacterium]MBP9701256.1 hypothetical protein [Candidatus Paceibacterota bacterium]
MAKIIIKELPPGPAPVNIRKAWIGIAIPFDTSSEQILPTSYQVDAGLAITGLEKAGELLAVEFYLKLKARYLGFPKNVCDLIE